MFHFLKVQYYIGRFKSSMSKISLSKYLDIEHGAFFFFYNNKCTFPLKIRVGQLYLASAAAVVFILRRKQYRLPLLLYSLERYQHFSSHQLLSSDHKPRRYATMEHSLIMLTYLFINSYINSSASTLDVPQ